MPKFSLLLGRKTIRVFDIDQDRVRVGRDQEADILIDNPSVSRSHAEFRSDGDGWVVEDLGSSNGTFVKGERISEVQPLSIGDEVGFGKFSIIFGKAVGSDSSGSSATRAAMTAGAGTTHIKSHEVKELLKDSERKRRAHLAWESGGRAGTHYLSEAPAALFGTGELCDVRVPKGPKHHLLVINTAEGCEARNLHWWTSMKVRGTKTKRARLRDGDVVEMGGLKLTFVDDLG